MRVVQPYCFCPSFHFRYTVRTTKFLSTGFTLGEVIVVIFGYFLRDERSLQLALFAPIVILLVPVFFIKESTRWLISKGHLSKAKQQILDIASINAKVSSPLEVIDLINQFPIKCQIHDVEDDIDGAAEAIKPKFTDLFQTRNMCARTIVLFFEVSHEGSTQHHVTI